MLTIFNTLKGLIDRYQRAYILMVSTLWLSLFLPVWTFLGQAQGDFNVALLIYIFPVLGILSLLAALIGRKPGLFVFGLLLVFAFPLTMAVGYALLGP